MLREEQIDKAKGIVRTYVDFHKDSSSSILNHNQLESILDKSIENLKNSKILYMKKERKRNNRLKLSRSIHETTTIRN